MKEDNDKTEGDYSTQLALARHNLDNLQALIRASDTKAAAFMTLPLFLGGTAIPVIKDSMQHVRLAPFLEIVAELFFRPKREWLCVCFHSSGGVCLQDHQTKRGAILSCCPEFTESDVAGSYFATS